MKRVAFTVVVSSVVSLALYVILSNALLWVLHSIENQTIKLSIISLVTTVLFVYILFYFLKIKEDICLKEVVKDYKNGEYISFKDDFKHVIKREKSTYICISVIVLGSFILNELDAIMFEQNTFSVVTMLFFPLCTFSTVFEMMNAFSFYGYLLNLFFICAVYTVVLLLYRRKKYMQWKNSNF